jgi:hypothetical protein
MKPGINFIWKNKIGELIKFIWSSQEENWIPANGICTVISNSNGILTYKLNNLGPFKVKLNDALIPSNIMEYPIDYAIPNIIK